MQLIGQLLVRQVPSAWLAYRPAVVLPTSRLSPGPAHSQHLLHHTQQIVARPNSLATSAAPQAADCRQAQLTRNICCTTSSRLSPDPAHSQHLLHHKQQILASPSSLPTSAAPQPAIRALSQALRGFCVSHFADFALRPVKAATQCSAFSRGLAAVRASGG